MLTAAAWLRDHARLSALRRWLEQQVEELTSTIDHRYIMWHTGGGTRCYQSFAPFQSPHRVRRRTRWFIKHIIQAQLGYGPTSGRRVAGVGWPDESKVAAARAVARGGVAELRRRSFQRSSTQQQDERRYAVPGVDACRLLRRRHAWPLLRAAVARRREERRKEKLRAVAAGCRRSSAPRPVDGNGLGVDGAYRKRAWPSSATALRWPV